MTMKKRDEILKKLPMPARSMPEQEANDDLEAMLADEAEETPEDEANESPEYQAKEEEMGVEEHNPELAEVDDADLIAEMKRRGLIAEEDGEEPEAPAAK
jgi:hypothetical protein